MPLHVAIAGCELFGAVAALLGGAKPTRTVGRGRANIPGAARSACCTSETIVRLILDNKVQRKWKLVGERATCRPLSTSRKFASWYADPTTAASP